LCSVSHTQLGDKVKVKRPPHAGHRGLVARVRRGMLLVRMVDTSKVVEVSEQDVINFSLAARRAWVSMPDRRVGRPKGSRVCDRISVTLRIDRDLWNLFVEMESDGRIEDRTATINRLLREKVAELEPRRAK